MACGTRAIIDAVFGPTADGEPAYLAWLLRSVHKGMIVLLDRGLSSGALLAAVAGTRADFLARLSAARKPPVLGRLPDGPSCRSWAASKSASSSARSPSPPQPAPRPGLTG